MPRFRNPVVSTANIIDGSVTTAKLADGAVTEPKVGAAAITEAKLDALAVTAAKLADSAVTATKIANLAVGTAAIANAAVTDAKIDTLSASKITAGTINTGDITIRSTLTMGSGGLMRTAAAGNRVEIGYSGSGHAQVDLYDSQDADGGGLFKANGTISLSAGASSGGQARPAITLYGPNAAVGTADTIALSTGNGEKLRITPTGPQLIYNRLGFAAGTYLTESWGIGFRRGSSPAQTLWSDTSILAGTVGGGGTNYGSGRFVTYNLSNRPQFTVNGDSDTGLGLPANNYFELWGGNTVVIAGTGGDIGLFGAGTTSNSGLPAYRSGSGYTESISRLVSSERYKKYVGPLTAADERRHLEVVHGHKLSRWQERGQRGGPWLFGITAEDAYKVQPEAVALDEEGAPLSFDPGNALAIPLLVAYRHLEARVAALEAA